MEHTLNGLLRKRAETAGIVESLQDQLHKAMIDMDHVDCTIRLFRPDIDFAKLKPKPPKSSYAASKGQVTRAILAILRNAGQPITARAITLALMEERALNTADKALVRVMRNRVGVALRSLRGCLENCF